MVGDGMKRWYLHGVKVLLLSCEEYSQIDSLYLFGLLLD